jgi:MraZ protein
MLLGRYYSQVSEKGRLALPAKFRQEVGEKVFIARWYEGCLVIVGASGWNIFMSRLAKKTDVLTKPIRSTERFIFSTASEVELDDQGRFVLPLFLRDIAGINPGDEVVFIGVGDRIELWNKSIWDVEEAKIKEESERMLEAIARQRK